MDVRLSWSWRLRCAYVLSPRDLVSSVDNMDETVLFCLPISHKKDLYEPRREKTGFLHMRKQRRRSASR